MTDRASQRLDRIASRRPARDALRVSVNLDVDWRQPSRGDDPACRGKIYTRKENNGGFLGSGK